jgi:hypothetical protein
MPVQVGHCLHEDTRGGTRVWLGGIEARAGTQRIVLVPGQCVESCERNIAGRAWSGVCLELLRCVAAQRKKLSARLPATEAFFHGKSQGIQRLIPIDSDSSFDAREALCLLLHQQQ